VSGEASRHVARARAITDPRDARKVYADWAETYDDDVYATLGFTGTARIVELAAQHVAWRDRPVIDLGCGTGAAGARLAELGFTVVDGLDLSPEMLAVAEAKGIYRRRIVADLTQPIPIPDGAYAAAVSAGTFTSGHVGPGALEEVIRVVEPGGVVACVVGASMMDGFGHALEAVSVEVLHQKIETIRNDGPPEGWMLVVRRL
jgi:predicted TPR repeat methyltransferase